MFLLFLFSVLAYIIYRIFFFTTKKSPPEIKEKNVKQDVVYLYQFPPATALRNVSPFCLKLESFLRVNNIKYENRFIVRGRSKYGRIPFVEINGEHFADSQLIEEHLKKYFNLKRYANEKDEAVARAVARMVSHHSSPIFMKYKAIDDTENFVNLLLFDVGGLSQIWQFLSPLTVFFMKSKLGKRLADSFGLFSDEEFALLLRKDLDVLRVLLGEKKFFFGDGIGNLDASVFGHLASNYYMPKANGVTKVLHAEYPTLVSWMERVKEELFEEDFTK